MTRVRLGAARKRKHKRVLKAAKGYYGAVKRRYRLAKQKTFKSGIYATRDRKVRKREFRALWITRLSAACRSRGIRYSQFIFALNEKNILLNRKMLADLAVADPAAFDKIVEMVRDIMPEKVSA